VFDVVFALFANKWYQELDYEIRFKKIRVSGAAATVFVADTLRFVELLSCVISTHNAALDYRGGVFFRNQFPFVGARLHVTVSHQYNRSLQPHPFPVAARISKESIDHSLLLHVLSAPFNLVEFCYGHTGNYQEIQ
jgi:hypothetical protein